MNALPAIDANQVRARLIDRMEQAGISQSELGRRSGVDQSSISNFISGKRETLGLEYVEAIAAGLGCTRQDLTGEPPVSAVRMIEARLLRPNQDNPRHTMDADALDGLRASIVERGVLQNLIVRGGEGDAWDVSSGHRRLAAIMLAIEEGDLAEDYAVPCLVRQGDDTEALTQALIENLHREDMHPLDEADAYAKLQEWIGCSAAEVARRIGKEPRYVQQRLALTEKLAEPVRQALRDEVINFTQARMFCSADADVQEKVLKYVVTGGWYAVPGNTEQILRQEQSSKERRAAEPARVEPSKEEKAEAERDAKEAKEAEEAEEAEIQAGMKAQAEALKTATAKVDAFNTLVRAKLQQDTGRLVRNVLFDLLRPNGDRSLMSDCVGSFPVDARSILSSHLGIAAPDQSAIAEGEHWLDNAFNAIKKLDDQDSLNLLVRIFALTAAPAEVTGDFRGYWGSGWTNTRYDYAAMVPSPSSRNLAEMLGIPVPADMAPSAEDAAEEEPEDFEDGPGDDEDGEAE